MDDSTILEIVLEDNEPMLVDPNWVVVKGGTYKPTDLVEVKSIHENKQVCAYFSLYVKTGNNS